MALFPDGLLEPFIRFRPDLIDVGRPTLCQFRVVGRIPGARGKLEGFALLVPADIPPENINGVGRARFVFGSGQPVQLVIDPSKNPKTLVAGDNPAIYSLEGDTLKVCIDEELSKKPEDVPMSLDTSKNEKWYLFVMKRAKK